MKNAWMKHDDGSHGCMREEDKKIEVLHNKLYYSNSFFKNRSPNLQHNDSTIMGVQNEERALPYKKEWTIKIKRQRDLIKDEERVIRVK